MSGSEAESEGEREPRRVELLGWETKVDSEWVRVMDCDQLGGRMVWWASEAERT